MSSIKPGKQSFLPPKSPFPTVPPGYAPTARGQRHHQRTSSESFLIEEQPSWLDELLDEPEMPVRRPAYRRASSDSFAYFDPTGAFDHAAYYAEAGAFGRPLGGGWEKGAYVAGYLELVPVVREAEGVAGAVERGRQEKAGQDLKGSPESKPETDTKRVKHNEFLKVSCNGGLNQMRAAICDMVTVAQYLNLTLVVPELDKKSFWADPSDFGDIFDGKYFIESLADEVHIIKRLPKRFHKNPMENILKGTYKLS